MNCLNHLDIIHTKVADAVHPDATTDLDPDDEYPSQLYDLTGTSKYLPAIVVGLDHDLTEADIRAIEQGPGTVDEFNWKACITRQVFHNCVQRMNRYAAQEGENTNRRLKIR